MIVRTGDRVLVHGMTGKQGSFWTEKMSAYGTNIVGGVSPKKAGTTHLDLPVFASAQDAIAAGAGLVVVLTEFIPIQDTMAMVAAAADAGARIIGPNTAGVVTPGEAFVGFMPAFDDRIFRPGRVGVISRSGSLGTLTCLELTRAGIGQSAFLGIGGDPVSGTSSLEAFTALDDDPGTDAIVLIGEIGGRKEEDAAVAIAESSKPVVSYIAGSASPPGKRMGHAGAIVEGNTGTHESKVSALTEAGVTVVDVPWQIPAALG